MSFDLHYLIVSEQWECVIYPSSNYEYRANSCFNVLGSNVGPVFGMRLLLIKHCIRVSFIPGQITRLLDFRGRAAVLFSESVGAIM